VPFTLTTGTNRFTGGSTEDTFDAGLSTGSLQTLNSGDQLDGGDGTDELFAVINTSVTPSVLKNIETVSFTNITTAATVDLSNATGITSVSNLASTVTQTLTGVATTVAVTVADTTADQVVTYSNTSGSADSATLGVRNINNNTVDSLTVAGIESLTLNVSGVNVLGTISSQAGAGGAVAGVGMTIANTSKLSVIGSGTSTHLGTLGTTVSTLDASKATAAITAQLSSTSATSVTGGTGNDTIHVGASSNADNISAGAGNDTVRFAANFTTSDTVTGGDGTDTLEIVTAANISDVSSAPTTYGTTGFETIALTSQAANTTYTPAFISATANRFDVTGRTAASGVNQTTAAALTTGAPTIVGPAGSFTVGLGTAMDTNAAGALAHGITITDTGTATTDSVTILNNAQVTNGAQVNVYAANTVTIDGYETVTINTGSVAGTAMTLGALAITPDGSGTSTTARFTGANIINTTDITASTIDASGITATGTAATTGVAAFFMAGTNTARNITGSSGFDNLIGHATLGSTIQGGAGNDSITGGALNDSILGGDGDDTITGGAGNADLINGGAGNDRVNFTNAQLTADDTIIGGDGNADVLAFSDAVTTSATTHAGISGFEVLTLDGAANTTAMNSFINNQGFTRLDLGQAGTGTHAVSNIASALTDVRLLTGIDGDTITLTRLTDTSSNALTISHRAGTASVTMNFVDEETVNISGATAADDLTAGAAIGSTDLTTLTITGAGDMLLAGAINAGSGALAFTSTRVATVNASLSSGLVSASAASSTSAITATAGSGRFSFVGGLLADTITGGAAADSLSGGSGNDIINANDGDDTVNGGAGADLITVGAGTDRLNLTTGTTTSSTSAGTTTNTTLTALSISGADVVTGMAAGDRISFSSTGNAFTAVGNAADGVFVAAAAVTAVIANNSGTLTRGSWVSSTTQGTGTFVVDANGSDTLYTYDSNGATATDAFVSVVLVGTAGVTGIHAFEAAAAATNSNLASIVLTLA
jgi:hypothetical protein